MLGNFSFGDYFKRDAIKYAYQVLTEVYKLPADRLVFTVYENDDEAYDAWTKQLGIDCKRVARMGPTTNFWQMADTGPCGPTSEIHWDRQPELGDDEIIPLLQAEDDRFLEILESRVHAIQSAAGRSRPQRQMGHSPARARC